LNKEENHYSYDLSRVGVEVTPGMWGIFEHQRTIFWNHLNQLCLAFPSLNQTKGTFHEPWKQTQKDIPIFMLQANARTMDGHNVHFLTTLTALLLVPSKWLFR
jgi:hypothetical protein